MRFSILSIILLTFWIALGVQASIGRQRQAQALEERAKIEARVKDYRREIEKWKGQEVLEKVEALRRESSQLEKLNQSIVKAFEEEADALSVLVPNDEKVSVRSLPTLGRSRSTQHAVKVHVPDARRVALKMDMHEKEGPDESSGSDRRTVQLEGEHPVIVPLKPGLHIIECLYNYRDDVDQPYFITLVDGEEVCRLTCPSRMTAYSSSHPNWLQQQDVQANRPLPKLLELRPGGTRTEIVVQLMDVKE